MAGVGEQELPLPLTLRELEFCRTNRVYPPAKTHGLIVDYLGIFDDVAKAFEFDDKSVQQVSSNIAVLREQLGPAIEATLAFFPGVDSTVGCYEGLIQAQTALETIVLDAQVIEDLMTGKRKDIDPRGREVDHRSHRQARRQPGLHRARPAVNRAAGEVRPLPAGVAGVPQGTLRASARHGRGGEGRR